MKKRIITLLLAFACCIPLFVGCDNAETPDENTTETSDDAAAITTQPNIITGTITNWKVPTPEKGADGLYKIIINDFERPADIGPVIAGQKNTACEVEKKIVHSGNQSFKIRYLNEDGGYDYANLRQPLNIEHRKDYSNFKTVKKISFWVYNAQTKAQTLTFAITLNGASSTHISVDTEIPSKEWTEVVINLADYSAIPTNKTVERMSFSFNRASYTKDTVFYIDDICLHSTTPM